MLIDSKDGVLKGVEGRVTTLFPGAACLFCRERITPGRIAAESLPEDRRQALAAEGYAPELGIPDPAVIAFTSAVASQAVAELLHRLSGFMGDERTSTEVLLRFHETEIRRNRLKPGTHCLCSERSLWGRGDTRNFLGLTWNA